MLMILYGANRFARNEYLAGYLADKNIEPEHVEGEAFNVDDLASLTQGQSLFSKERLIIIHDLSENNDGWTALSEWLTKRELETDIILLEDKLDKRKVSTKALMDKATLKEFISLKDGDIRGASSWLLGYAETRGIKLASGVAMELVKRVGFDQGMLANELQRLSVISLEVSMSTVEAYTPAKLEARVFSILEAALRGDEKYVVLELNSLRQLSDPYRFMGLLVSQIFQFAAINSSGVSLREVSSGLKLSLYSLENLSRVDVGREKVKYACSVLAEADFKMKSTSYEPWDIIEFALIDIALK